MKLHLPKALLTAVLATFVFAPQSWAGWASDNRCNGYIYYYDEESASSTKDTFTLPTATNGVTNVGSKSDKWQNIYMVSGYGGDNQPQGYAGQNTTIGKVVADNNVSLTIAQNPWQGWKYYDALTIGTLEYGEGNGSGSFNVTHANDKVAVNAVSGCLSSVTNAGNLTLGTTANEETGADASVINLSGSITNTGNLTLNGTFTFDVSSFDNYVKVEGSGGTTIVEKNERGNGFITYVGVDYYLLNNSSGTQLITSAATIQTANGLETKKLDDQSVVVTAGQTLSSIYAVVSGTETYGGDSATVDAGATAIQVSKGAELVLAGDYDIRKITGEGTLTLAKNYTLANGVHSVGAGTLKINSGVTLTVGGGTNQNAGIASYEAVELAGGTLKFHCNGGTVHNLTVNSESTLRIQDMAAQTSVIKLDGTTTLNDKLNLTHGYKGTLNIVKLTGTGDLQTTLISNGYADALRVTIDSIDKYSGTITYDNSASRGNAMLTIGAGADSVVNLGTTISVVNAPVVLNGQFILDDENGAFETYGTEAFSAGENGYRYFTGDQYFLVRGDENSSFNIGNVSSVTLTSGGTSTLDTTTVAGSIIFKGKQLEKVQLDEYYYVNTTVDSRVASDTVFKVNAEGAVLNVVGTLSNKYISYVAGSVNVADTGTLIIDTTTDDAVNVLLNATGEGNIALNTGMKLTGNVATQATGTLTIADDVQLELGASDGTEASLSSFNSIVLDGGHIRVQNKKDTWNNVTVTEKGASLHVYDLANDETDNLTLAGTTTLNGNLSMTNDWGERITINKLSGSGSLIIDDANGRNDRVSLSINGVDNFGGQVQVSSVASNLALSVAENLGLTVKYTSRAADNAKNHLILENIGVGNTIILAGSRGYLSSGAEIAADIVFENYNNWAGLELNDGYFAVSTFTGDISGTGNFVINKDSLNNHGVTFTGDVTRWTGRVDVAKGTHTITYTGDASAVKNLDILVRGGSTADIVFDHTKAATVTAPIINDNSTLNLVVKNTAAEGTTFSGSVQATTATIKAGTVANFTNAEVQMTNLLVETGAQLSFTAKDALNVSNLSVANVGTITVVNGDAAGSLSASGAVTLAGGATINAAVVDLSGASSVSFDVASGAITLNGALTMRSTDAFVAALGNSLAGLTAGEMLIVFTGLESFTIGDVTSADFTSADLSTWSSSDAVAAGQYTVEYQVNNNVGSIVITVGEVIPEPASATLSLAALMMLCARRRRRA